MDVKTMSPFLRDAYNRANDLDFAEQILGKATVQPFPQNNSGNRKLMFSVHTEQALPLMYKEVPFVQTGYEQQWAERSSSVIKADGNLEIVGKICKFQDNPQKIYYIITRDIKTNQLGVIERKEYLYTTETYGYEYDNRIIDQMEVGGEISKGDIIRTSDAFDEYGNYANTVNLLSTYVATDKTMEDSVWISETAQHKLTSVLYKRVTVNINDNDILLNLMGDNEIYKSFPSVGEKVKNGILCAVRREKTEDSLFTQSVQMLQKTLMSDTIYTPGNGCEVIDINIRCNNPETLSSKYTNSSALAVYNDHIRFIKEFVETVNTLMYKYHTKNLSPELDKMRYIFDQELKGVQFMDQKVYTGTIIEFMLKEINVPSVGDKISNRCGGKGVIAQIIPDELMPRVALTGEPLEMLFNAGTCPNRLNPGQFHELSLTHIGKCICDLAKLGIKDRNETFHEYIKFLGFFAPEEAEEMANCINSLSEEEKDMYFQSILESGNIIMSVRPMAEEMTLDVLDELYRAFPYVTQRQILMPLENSRGQIRFVPARRLGVVGHFAMYRLQQYAEEKHSVTAMSSTNLRNENSRNKANKNYKATHQATPVNFGNMELGDLGHMGMEHVVEFLMIHSVSPHARRLVEQIFIDDPYLVNIRLDKNSKNRSAEILAAYMKFLGYRLVFEKKRKHLIRPFKFKPFVQSFDMTKCPSREINFLPDGVRIKDFDEYLDKLCEAEKYKKRRPFMIKPFSTEYDAIERGPL